MLENVIADFVDGLPDERAIDGPLDSLLRAEGFFDIAFVHGTSELGRDFIAKHEENGVVRQFNFQSKHGDLKAASFRDVRQQLEDIRTTQLAHPSYDSELEGVIVLVTNGRLVGDARAQADGYGKTLPDRWSFEIWTRGKLIDLLERHLHAALADQARGSLLKVLGSIDDGTVSQHDIERHSRQWVPDVGAVDVSSALEASLLARRLAGSDRLDLASNCLLALVRAHLASNTEELGERVEAASREFAWYALELWKLCTPELLQPENLLAGHNEFGLWITYPTRCLLVIEILSLLALWQRENGQTVLGIEDWIAAFIEAQPGTAHPPSDRYAISFVAPTLVLSARRPLVEKWLRDTTAWVADRYEGESRGLAAWDASPDLEVSYLLGDLDYGDFPDRRESLVASTVLDLTSALGLSDLYDDAHNEFAAVKLLPVARYATEGRDAWLKTSTAVRQETNPPYAETFGDARNRKTAPHQGRDFPRPRSGGWWETLAVWSVVRDRLSPSLISHVLVTSEDANTQQT